MPTRLNYARFKMTLIWIVFFIYFFVYYTHNNFISYSNCLDLSISKIITSSQSSYALPQRFKTVSDLLDADLKDGDIVITEGFYSKNDGGGGIYKITSENLPVDNMFTLETSSGLKASLQPSGNNVNVDQLGAKGDGTSDDSAYLQAAFSSQYKVSLGESKNYKLVSNGLAIRRDLDVDGHNSHIIVDDSYSPINNDFSRFIIRGNNKSHSYFRMSNLNIDVNITASRYSGSNYLCVMQPTYIDRVILNNVNISVAESNNCITNFWLNHGCQNLTISNCVFINNTTSFEGGMLFFNSESDPYYHKYTSFDNISISDSDFIGTCGDEQLAIWGPNNVSATLTRCNFKWNRASATGKSRPINISTELDNATIYNVTFNTCNFECSDSQNGRGCDSFLGVGTRYPYPKINVYFNNCIINAKVQDCLLHFQQLVMTPYLISNFVYTQDHFNINFNCCDVTCNKTINGSNQFYDPTSSGSWAIDCTFTNSKINCKYCVVLLQYYANNYYYAPSIKLINNDINITDSYGVIYKTNQSAYGALNLQYNRVTADNNNQLCTVKYNSYPTGAISQQKIH